MSRAAVLAFVVAIAPANACGKLRGNRESPSSEPTPAPLPVTSATTPPIWAPPDTGGPLPTSAPPPSAPNPELAKARALALAGDHKKVRTLLDKKVKSGKATTEEAAVLLESCTALRDKACVDLVKAKHPELQAP